MIVSIREIILSYELLNRKYYQLLLSYLFNLTSINFWRMSEISENIKDLFLALADSKNELAVKFAVDFLSFMTNLAFRRYITKTENQDQTENLKNIDFCLAFINHLAEKQNNDINLEILKIYESLIDKNGYEIPASFWRLILEKFQFIVNVYEKTEISNEISKISLLSSF